MKISRSEIITRVKLLMEELPLQWESSFEQKQGLSIDRYIDGVIEEQLRLLLLTAPVKILPIEDMSRSFVPVRHSDGSGTIYLLPEVLRPISLQMEGWSIPVTQFLDENHPLSRMQYSRYTSAGANKPVAVWCAGEAGVSRIDYFSLPQSLTQHHIQSLLVVYVADVKPEEYNLHPLLIDCLCFRCASMVYDIMGNRAMAEVMLSHIAFGK